MASKKIELVIPIIQDTDTIAYLSILTLQVPVILNHTFF